MVVDHAVFPSPDRRPDHVVQVERRPEILAPVRPGRVDRLPLPGHRPSVEPEARPAMALEPRGGEAFSVGQVVREPPHQPQGVAKALSPSSKPAEVPSRGRMGHELTPMEQHEMVGGVATGVMAGVPVAEDDIL